MFNMEHLFQTTAIWEASFAKRLNRHIPDIEKKWGAIGQSVILVIGLVYTLAAVIFRVVATAFLVTLYLTLNLVIPLLYICFNIAFTVSSFVYLFRLTLDSEWQVFLDVGLSRVVYLFPGVVVLVVYFTIYWSLVYVMGKLYMKSMG